MMARMLAGALLLAAVAPAQPNTPAAPARTPIVVELFTSEACSSCPPADRVLARLDREQPVPGVEIIALGEHVDYWNQTGWVDPFSSPLFSARQQDYGQAFRMESIYTPQMVVEGQAQVLGSDWSAANQAIRAAAHAPQASVRIWTKDAGVLSFEVRGLPRGTKAADILLAITADSAGHFVRSGENAGERLSHTAIVQSLTNLGKLDTGKNGAYAADARLNLNPRRNRSNLRVVLFVQDRSTRRILGAATLRITNGV